MRLLITGLTLLGLLTGIAPITYGQDSYKQDSLKNQVADKPIAAGHTIYAGLQLPLNYTLGYRYRFNRRLSIQAEGALIDAPFDRYTLKLLEGFGLDPNLTRVIDRSFRRGSSVSLGVSLHSNSAWYGTIYGQYAHFSAGPITPADGLGIYFRQDFTGFGLLDSPAFVFNLQSSLWIAGVRVGRSFRFGDSRFGLNTELSLGKVVATQNKFSSNRPLIDGLGVTERLYSRLNDEIDVKLRQHGFLPTLNLMLTYRVR